MSAETGADDGTVAPPVPGSRGTAPPGGPDGPGTGRLIFTMPAYNEAPNLPKMFDRIRKAAVEARRDFLVVVCDDGSGDGTAGYLGEAARTLPVRVVTHETNLGYGPAMTDALMLAAEAALPGDVIVTLDADATQDPGYAPGMADKIAEGFDVVIASRYAAGAEQRGTSPLRRILSLGAGALLAIVFPTKGVRDYSCGFRAIDAGFLSRALDAYGGHMIESPGFSATPELLLKLRAAGARFAEVGFTLRYDEKEGASKIRIWRTIRQYFALMWRLTVHPPRPRMGSGGRY